MIGLDSILLHVQSLLGPERIQIREELIVLIGLPAIQSMKFGWFEDYFTVAINQAPLDPEGRYGSVHPRIATLVQHGSGVAIQLYRAETISIQEVNAAPMWPRHDIDYLTLPIDAKALPEMLIF
ncbi:hypothetical protein [Erythrobacter mangrovi]|uniref:Uncharacterized protein n=1 Tax=Erythrobacter mangrovi TaxID=2739433 RepID=A0A7D4B8C2_9SPHN|nr:hypothetical protein [Erythrobacter mangrovi]QKG71703.1 hypothetical protein HQR01_10190 [Erythrobacter mangrovi]